MYTCTSSILHHGDVMASSHSNDVATFPGILAPHLTTPGTGSQLHRSLDLPSRRHSETSRKTMACRRRSLAR